MAVLRVPTHLAYLSLGLARGAGAVVSRTAASLWESIAGLLTGTMAGTAGGMIVAGDAAFTSHAYDVVRQIPGGMRTYGVLLAVLVVAVVYGQGRAHNGRGRVLRVALAATCSWYMGWFLAIGLTYILQGQVYSWSLLMLDALAATIATLVGRTVPPDTQG